MKKITSMFLSLIMIIGLFIVLPAGAEAIRSGKFEYELRKDGTAEITGYTGSETTITVPEKLGGYTVSRLGWYWMSETKVKILNLPSTVSSYDSHAFSADKLTAINVDENNPEFMSIDGVLFTKNAEKLIKYPASKGKNTVYTVPDGVQIIGTDAFAHSAVKGINLPNSVTELKTGAFYCCEKLTSVTVPKKVKKLEPECFYNCTKLKTINLNKELKEIGEHCFEFCDISSIKFNEGLEKIGNNAFAFNTVKTLKLPASLKYLSGFDNTSVTKVDVPASVETLGEGSFSECWKLKKVTLHKGLKTIGEVSFFDCNNLKSIKIPSTVTHIEADCFVDTKIKKITLPESLKKLDVAKSFFGVFPDSLKKLSISKSNKKFSTKNGILYNKKRTKILYYPNSRGLKKFKLPNSVKTIPANCFNGAVIEKLTVGKKIKVIGKEAFAHSSIGTVVFKKGLKTIKSYAFDFSYVDTVKLPNTVKTIESGAFSASSLSRINIPKSVRTIGKEAFFGTNLGKITVPPSVKKIGKYAIGILYGECGTYGGVNKNTVIRCKRNSAAYKYAKKYKVKYELY